MRYAREYVVVKARLARQLDVLALKRLVADRNGAVIPPSAFEDTPSVFRAAVMPGAERIWIAEEQGAIAGFVHARPRRYVLGWEIVRLHVHPDLDAVAVLAALVSELLLFLQERGIPRLFARTPADAPAHALLLECGFTHLLSETVWSRNEAPPGPPSETPVGLRYRMPQDAWPLRQLENDQTPLLVSQLEGLTSLGWSLPRRPSLHKDDPNEFVVEREGEITAWLGWTKNGSRSGHYVKMGLLTQLDDASIADPLLEYGLHVIGSIHPEIPILFRLRDYRQELRGPLLAHGFSELGRETVHIKHGRLQILPKKAGRLLELAPTLRALTLDPTPKAGTHHA